MRDVTNRPSDDELRAMLAPAMDREARIPAALEALGPVSERDVAVLDPGGGELTARLLGLGSWVRSVPAISGMSIGSVPDGRADVVVAGWSAFLPGSPDWDSQLVEARRVLRPDGRLLVAHDYGRDDVTPLLGDADRAARLTAWSRPNGPFLRLGFRIRVLHCWWRWDTIDEAADVLARAFGELGSTVAAGMRRPRLSWKVAVYHLGMDASPVAPTTEPQSSDAHRSPVRGGGAASPHGMPACT